MAFAPCSPIGAFPIVSFSNILKCLGRSKATAWRQNWPLCSRFRAYQSSPVVSLCPYVSSFIRKHVEYQDLISSEDLQKLLSE